MTIEPKESPGPFMGWPGARGWVEGWAPVLEANRVGLDRWTKVSGTMVEAMFAISREMSEFAQARLRDEAKNCEALGRCRSPAEALDCQRRHAESATTEYLEEANKLTALMTRIANHGFTTLQHPRP